VLAASPLILGELVGCLGHCANGGAKNTVVCFRKWRTYTKKGEWTWWKWTKHTIT